MKTYRLCFLFLAMLMAMPMTVSAKFTPASDKDAIGGDAIIPPGNGVIPINLDSIREAEIDSLTKVAEQGSVEAQKKLGRIYRYKDYNKQDYKEALKWYRKAAEQGDAEAQTVLGDFYREGSFFAYDEAKQDYVEAAKWYRKAAEQGDAGAQLRLGDLYCEGNGVKQDYAEAAKWYRKATEHGLAYKKLAGLYASGKGVKKDYDEAIKLYLTAADDIEDYDILGDLYATKHDYSEATKWYRKAADNDKEYFNYISDKSQLKLGLCYAFGKGVKQDFSEATKLIKGWIKGFIEDFTKEMGKVTAYIFGTLILLLFIFLFFGSFSVKKKQFGLAKSIILAFAFTALFFLSLVLLPFLILLFISGQPLITSDFLLFFVFLLLSILWLGLIMISIYFATEKKTINANSISAESEKETFEDSLLDDKKGHKVKFYIANSLIINFTMFMLAFIIGVPYYWLVTKALGHEPLSPLSSSSGFQEDPPQLIISLLIFVAASIIGLIVFLLLQRIVWGWRNTSISMSKKDLSFGTYCSKPLKKSQYIKGLIIPYFVVGLLPLLVSPFVNSFVLCFLGILLIGSSDDLIRFWKLRKEPHDCMIQDIKGEKAVFVLDEDQPADNK